MNEVIYRGLRLSSSICKYFQVKEGLVDSLIEDKVASILTLTYTPGSTSLSLSKSLGIEVLGKSMEMFPMPNPKMFKTTILTLNGLKLKKLTYDKHVINIIIVSDSDSRVVQNYDQTTLIISKNDYKDQEFINYLFFSGNLLYLSPIGKKPDCIYLRNFPKIIIGQESVELNSDSETIFTLRRRYNDYVIREIDYQDQFLLEIRKILDDYGLELVRINREETLKKTSYVTYQFLQTPVLVNHPRYIDPDNKILQQRLPIEFTLRCTDMVMYFDFKKKYQNVDLLTNFCEFKTTDKYGERWTAAVKWGQISEDFNHIYMQDDNSNFSFQCQFRCELYFYEMFDDRYEFLNEIIANLESEDMGWVEQEIMQ